MPVASVSESGEKTLPGAARFLQTGYFRQIVARAKNIFCAHELYKLLLLASVCQKQENPPGARTLSVFPTNRCVPVASVSESGEKPFQAQRFYHQLVLNRLLRARRDKYLCAHTIEYMNFILTSYRLEYELVVHKGGYPISKPKNIYPT